MTALRSLDAPARVALFLLSLASRPLPQDFPSESAEVVRITRRNLHALSVAASVGLGLHAFNTALRDLAGDGDSVPALRLVSHAGMVLVDIGLADLADDTDEAWISLLSDGEALLGDDDDDDGGWLDAARATLPAFGLDVESPLPSGLFSPPPSTFRPTARRCGRCEEVQLADAFSHNGSRLMTVCRRCDAQRAREYRRAHPEVANRPRHRRPRPSANPRTPGFTLS